MNNQVLNPEVKLKDGEYADLNSILRNAIAGKIYTDKEYRETGLFLKDRDSYYVEIPACMRRILKFVGNSRRSNSEFEGAFFLAVLIRLSLRTYQNNGVYFL